VKASGKPDFATRHKMSRIRRRPEDIFDELIGMPTYSKGDLERIAAAIGVDVARVAHYAQSFEAAATWYRLDREGAKKKRSPTAVTKKKLDRIGNAARRLFKHLNTESGDPVKNGDRLALLEGLACAEGGTEDSITRATESIARLVEIFDALDATRLIESLARKAAQDAEQIGKLTVPKEHRGHAAENGWVAYMMSIYKRITGKEPGTSINAPGRPDAGKAAGPLVRFLQAAGKPLGIEYSVDSWRGRVRDARTGGRRQK